MDRVKFANVAIDALEGTRSVAELFGFTEQRVFNWRKRGLPPESYDVLAPQLRKLRYEAPPVMFGQYVAVGRLRRAKANGK
jgi:hypothetical protein